MILLEALLAIFMALFTEEGVVALILDSFSLGALAQSIAYYLAVLCLGLALMAGHSLIPVTVILFFSSTLNGIVYFALDILAMQLGNLFALSLYLMAVAVSVYLI